MNAGNQGHIAQATADEHGCAIFAELSGIILGKKALTRNVYAANPGNADLSSMGMTAEYQINREFRIGLEQFRAMNQENLIRILRAGQL